MTEARKRELERLALAGDLDAGAALLTLRVRAGELSRVRVGLAAWLGNKTAQEVALKGVREWVPVANLEGLHEIPFGGLTTFTDMLTAWGTPASVVAACALAAVSLRPRDRADERTVRLLQSAIKWATTETDTDWDKTLALWTKAYEEDTPRIVLLATALDNYTDPKKQLRSVVKSALRKTNRVQLFEATKKRVTQWALA